MGRHPEVSWRPLDPLGELRARQPEPRRSSREVMLPLSALITPRSTMFLHDSERVCTSVMRCSQGNPVNVRESPTRAYEPGGCIEAMSGATMGIGPMFCNG